MTLLASSDLVPLNVVLGHGAFGEVSKFKLKGVTVAVKELYDPLDYDNEFWAQHHLSKGSTHPFIAGMIHYTVKTDKGYLVFGEFYHNKHIY